MALHRGTIYAGGHVAYDKRVTGLSRTEEGFRLVISDLETGVSHILEAQKVVSAAGPYTGALLKDVAPEFEHLITPQRVFLAFFEVEPGFWNGLSASEQRGLIDLFPAINSTLQTRASGSFSMIEGYSERGAPVIKIGGHYQRTDIKDMDRVWQQSLTDEEIAWSYDALLHHLALLDADFTEAHCIFMPDTRVSIR